jgi:hypothetical protein
VAWLVFARKLPEYRLLGIFFAISAPLKLLSLVTAKLDIHNMPVYHLLALTEVVMIYCFYCRLAFKKIYFSGAMLLTLLNLWLSLFIQKLTAFNSIGWTLDMLILIIIGILYLFRLYNDEQDDLPLQQRPVFIITAAWLIYASGSLFTYLMGTSILSGRAEGFFHNAWIFQCVSNLFKNLLISYALWKARILS